jgi:4'-phosphopantetheinyl transferase
MQEVPQGEIHLWFAFGDTAEGPREARRVLDAGELARLARLRPEDRRLFAASHALVRTTLSRYGELLPGQWRFVQDARGKPGVAPGGAAHLKFSLSHTRGAALVAIADGVEVGADLEREDRRLDAARLSRRFFAPREDAALRQGPSAPEGRGFFHFWTLKEAYLKARGLGLALPLDAFSFELAGEAPGRIGFSGEGGDRAGLWRFALLTPQPPYVAAVGCCLPGPVRIRCFVALPAGRFAPLAVRTLALSPGVKILGEPPGPAAP